MKFIDVIAVSTVIAAAIVAVTISESIAAMQSHRILFEAFSGGMTVIPDGDE